MLRSILPHSGPALAVALLATTLAACRADRVVTGSTYPRDYRDRHPIVLTDAPRSLDVFVNTSGGLDPRQHADVRTFADEYAKYGKGPVIAQVPTGPGTDLAVHRTIDAIRAAMAAGGAPHAHLSVSTYAPADPRLASPVRLTFQRLQAKVSSRCGLWPQDLGISDPKFNVNNEPYWNLGCAMQTNVAAQVDDPLDLVRGRTAGRIDTVRRAKDLENLRQAKDPSTVYRSEDKGRINDAVGN